MKRAYDSLWIPVILTGIIIAALNSGAFFLGLIKTPPGHIYLGTVHYWEDYFFYLNHFFQGASGTWATVNRYTTEPTNTSFIYWSNLMMGKIGSTTGVDPILSYNLWLIILVFIQIIMAAVILKNLFPKNRMLWLGAFTFTVFSTSLQNRVLSDNNQLIWWPYQIWKTPHFAFDRLGGAPHQVLQTVFFYLLSYFLISGHPGIRPVNLFTVMVISAILTSLNPVASGIILGCAVLTLAFRIFIFRAQTVTGIKYMAVKWVAATVSFLIVGAYMFYVMNTQPHIQTKQWESANQSLTSWPFLALSIGPVLLFFACGVFSGIRSRKEYHIFSILLVIITYLLFMGPVPQFLGLGNVRFLFPGTYLFMGIIASQGLSFITRYIYKFTKISPILTGSILICLFMIVSAATIIWELREKFKPIDRQYAYISSEIFAGYDYLKTQFPYNDAVLGNPEFIADSLIPPLSGHTSYSGHILHTIGNNDKKRTATSFFNGKMTDPEKFLSANSIRYVLDINNKLRLRPILPLVPVYRNSQVTVYEVKL